MVTNQNAVPLTVSRHMSTGNKSFLDMHYWLKSQGIKHNDFFLALYDTDLASIDPRDPRLNEYYKRKVLRECMINYWYFLREIIRIPDTGGAVGGGVRYKLDRGNLALNFGFINNWNMFLELPRQFGKTTSALCYYLWVFQFGTTNSEIMFMNKKHDDSKMNLTRLKNLRDALPDYLKMDAAYGPDGKKLKPTNNAQTLSHISNGNKITTKPGAHNKTNANSLGRGCTMPLHWYDEYAFILFNKIIYASATPAYKTASENAKRNHKPYGILITTTPGDLTTDEGLDAFETKNAATPFDECYYDYTYEQIQNLKNCNRNSSFFYIKFTYQQLGRGDEYFREMVVDLKKDWPSIRREVLLEWANMASNSPFTQQDLKMVEGLLCKEPLYKIHFGNGTSYVMDVWTQTDINRYPPIVGVDVSGGYQKDSSAITVIDSKTTDVMATFNCNYISTKDLAKVIYELVTSYMPNAIVNIERNGGFGASVLTELIHTRVKRNLYYEVKDRVFEERNDGMNTIKRSKRVKVYGFDETKRSRELLMEILRNRMDNHKSRFKAKIIYDELCTLEIKKNGRIEHASNAHDDQIFSMLMALYVWYEGKNLMENFGIQISQISTDEDNIESLGLEEDLDPVLNDVIADSDNELISEQAPFLNSKVGSKSYQQWQQEQQNLDLQAEALLLRTHAGRQAYAKAYHEDINDLEKMNSTVFYMPASVYTNTSDEVQISELQQRFNNIIDIR